MCVKCLTMARINSKIKGKPGVGYSLNLAQLPYYLGYQIRQAQISIFRDISRSMKGINLTPGEFSLLTLVKNNIGVSQIDLANAYDIDKSTLSHSVKRMVERGLIIRSRLSDDKRYYGLNLTTTGELILNEVTNLVLAQEDTMDGALAPGERKLFLDMLTRICNVLEKTG